MPLVLTAYRPVHKYLGSNARYSARAVVLNAVGDRYSRPPPARGAPGCLLDTSGHLAQ
jgi:hypothetical protein